MSPNGAPMERDAPSPEPMVYAFIYISQSPSEGALTRHTGKTYGLHSQSPKRREGLPTMGCCLVPQGDCLRHSYLYPSAMQPSARYLPL
jgi:hypothetical protein